MYEDNTRDLVLFVVLKLNHTTAFVMISEKEVEGDVDPYDFRSCVF